MLAATNFVGNLQHILRRMQKLNIIPLQYPYIITYCRKQQSYNFQTNTSFLNFHWKIHFAILYSAVCLSCVSFHLDRKSLYERFTLLTYIVFCAVIGVTVIYHKYQGKHLSNFYNLFAKYEKGNNYNVNNSSRNLIALACQLFSLGTFLEAVFFSTSCALFPSVPWNPIPSFIWTSTLQSKIVPKLITSELFLIIRILIFVYVYIVMRSFTNFALLDIVLNLLVPNFCFDYALLELRE